MTASLFGIGGTLNVNVNGTLVPESFVGTGGQTVFTLTNFTYVPGTNSLLVFINGQRQILTRDFLESSTTSFTLIEGVVAGDYIDVIGFPEISLEAVEAGSVTYTLPASGAVTRQLNSRLSDYVSVRDFGAVGDGSTDDTAAIQAAADFCDLYGRTLYFPSTGDYYRTNAPITLGYVCNWVGEHATYSIIRNKAGSGHVLSFPGGDDTGPYFFSNLRIGGGNCIGMALTSGGMDQYIPRLHLDGVYFEGDLLIGISALLIFFIANNTWFGAVNEITVNAANQGIVSGPDPFGARNTNICTMNGGGFYNCPTTAVSISSGFDWTFNHVDWEVNRTNLYTLNIQNLELNNCWCERVTPNQFEGAFKILTNVIPARVNGGFYALNDSGLPSDSAIFQVSTDAKILVENCILEPATAFTYYNSTSISHTPPLSGLHAFKNNYVGGNVSDPLHWMSALQEDTPQSFTPTVNNFTVVNGTGGVTYSGTYSIRGRMCFFTIEIITTGTATTASNAGSSYFDAINAAVIPQQFAAVGAVDSVVTPGTSLGNGVAHTNGRIYLPTWSARAGSIAISGSFLF